MDADGPRPLRPQCLEKNLPDVIVDGDSTLGGCSPLSWCGIVSPAGVITICIGGVATHPLQAIRFVSRFIPAEPGPSLSIVLCLESIVCIVCMVPVWAAALYGGWPHLRCSGRYPQRYDWSLFLSSAHS